jgi:tellurite methyltransferase
MLTSLSEWDAKHRAAAESEAAQPAGFVRELLPLLPLGPALDLACGTGRHTLLLAERHQPVTAVDGSSVALDILARRARAAGDPKSGHGPSRLRVNVPRPYEERSPTIAASQHGIRLVQTDLERATLPVNSFALILCVNYLQRSLFSQMERALAPGGMLLFETHTRAQLEFAGGPRNPMFLLDPGELRVAFPSLRLLFYRELRAGKGIASLIGQRRV